MSASSSARTTPKKSNSTGESKNESFLWRPTISVILPVQGAQQGNPKLSQSHTILLVQEMQKGSKGTVHRIKMIKRSMPITVRWLFSDIEEIEKHVKSHSNPDGKFNDTSEAIRELVKVGAKVIEYQQMMKDPAKADEFRQKMNEMMQTDKMDQWSETLSNEQLDGVIMFLNIEKEKRYDQKKFR